MKKFAALLLSIFLLFAVTACGSGETSVPYFDGISEDGSYDTSLFYRNDLNTCQAADPGCIYVPEERDPVYGGYFYMYVTGLGFPVMRSKDLNNWEKVGYSFTPTADSWCNSHLWAPEVIYNEGDGLYYLYHTSSSKIGDATTSYSSSSEYQDRLYTGIAVSATPVGPFEQWTGVNARGERIDVDDPPINFRTGMNLSYDCGVIDASPFFDTDGTLYLYYTTHRTPTGTQDKNEIWGVKMLDMVTPDYSTVTRLTEPGKYTPGGEDFPWESEKSSVIDEGPNMIYHNGKYYLTYSPIGFSSPYYSVSVAVSDEPLGTFTKVPAEQGNPVVGIEPYYDFMRGTGHHCFVWAGDELFTVYHAHRDRATGAGNPRAIAADRLFFEYNEELGFDMLYCNGPTYSVQPLPEMVSGYTNVSSDASVTASNALSEDTVKYLTDGRFVMHDYDTDKEFSAKGSTVIELTFEKPVYVAAVMVYNSYNYDHAFASVESIELELSDPALNMDSVKFADIPFSEDFVREDLHYMRPGGSSYVEFAPMWVKSVRIKISDKLTYTDYDGNKTDTISVSDIVVLGKRSVAA